VTKINVKKRGRKRSRYKKALPGQKKK